MRFSLNSISCYILKIAFLLLVTTNLLSCGVTDSSVDNRDSITIKDPAKEKSKWEYKVDVDKMTSEKSFTATLYSEENLHLSVINRIPVFPTIEINKDKDGTNIYVTAYSLSSSTYNGQFDNDHDVATIEVKFDNEKVKKFRGTTAAISDKSYVSINAVKLFLTKLRKAKKVLVRATFVITQPTVIRSTRRISGLRYYRRTRSNVIEGKDSYREEIMEFHPSGLKWNYSYPEKKLKIRKQKK